MLERGHILTTFNIFDHNIFDHNILTTTQALSHGKVEFIETGDSETES